MVRARPHQTLMHQVEEREFVAVVLPAAVLTRIAAGGDLDDVAVLHPSCRPEAFAAAAQGDMSARAATAEADGCPVSVLRALARYGSLQVRRVALEGLRPYGYF